MRTFDTRQPHGLGWSHQFRRRPLSESLEISGMRAGRRHCLAIRSQLLPGVLTHRLEHREARRVGREVCL